MKKLFNHIARPGAGAFDALAKGLKAIWMLAIAPGRKWLDSESRIKQICGAGWCAFTGYVLPVSIYKVVIGAVFAHNVFYAWM